MTAATKIVPMRPKKKDEQTTNPAWAFNLDPVHHWAYWDSAFTKEECEKIVEIGNSYALKKAKTVEERSQSRRKSEVSWLYPSEELDWAYRRMTSIIMDLNDRFFNFDLFGAMEGFQFTKYGAPDGRYGKHIDSTPNTLIRKLSFTLQLSDPEKYKGGDLALYFGENPEYMNRDQGCVTVFPSYILHEITPVTEGTRYALVSWITGKPFR